MQKILKPNSYKINAIILIIISLLGFICIVSAHYRFVFSAHLRAILFGIGIFAEIGVFLAAIAFMILFIIKIKKPEVVFWFSVTIVLSLLSILFTRRFYLPESGIISRVSRVRADQRELAIALEAYYVDNNSYPMQASGKDGVNSFAPKNSGAYKISTFKSKLLTTPIQYLDSLPRDSFSTTVGATFGYYTDGKGWILYSWGPDQDENKPDKWDLAADVTRVYNSEIPQPSITLITGGSSAKKGGAYTYDPSNGTISEGDIYRVMQ